MVYSCCGFTITNPVNYKTHMNFHSNSNVLNNFACPICSKVQKRKDHFKEHLLRLHKPYVIGIFPEISQHLAEQNQQNHLQPQFNPFSVVVNQNRIEIEHPINSNIDQNDFEMESENDSNCSLNEDDIPYLEDNETNDHARNYQLIFSRMLTNLKYSLNCAQKHLNIICSSILSFILDLFMKNILDARVLNDLIKVAKSTRMQENNCERIKLLKNPNNDFYYTDLREIIEEYLKEPEICKQLFFENKRRKSASILKNINDAQRCRQESGKIKIKVNYYWDDYDIKRYSKSSSAKTKISVVYFCIGNIDYQYQSKRNHISLAAIGKASDIETLVPNDKRAGIKRFFGEIRKQLREINNNPISIKNRKGEIFQCDVELSSMSADNLAMNQMMHVSCGFSNSDCCQYCTFNFGNRNIDQSTDPRNLDDLDHIFRGCKFDGRLYVADIFHDLNEGIVLNLMNFILQMFTPTEVTTLSNRLEDFKSTQSIDLPLIVLDSSKKEHLKGTGVQYMNFFMVFPFINTKITFESQIYQQYLVLRKIVNFVSHHEVKVDELEQFDEDVEEYLRLNTLNGISYTLKAHHLTHYSMLMKEFGPLINYSTLRFERVHQIGKSAINSSQNRKNVAFSIAKAYTISKKITKASAPDIEVLITRDHIRQELDNDDFLKFVDLNQDLKILESTTINKVRIKTGNYYLYKNGDCTNYNYPIFFYSDLIIRQDQIKVLGFLMQVEYFDRKTYSYKLKDLEVVKELDIDRLPFYRKLKYINNGDDGEYISKDFHINYDLICYQV